MGMLYRRKKKNEAGELVEVGPWWMKYYDNGRPVCQSTGTFEKREAVKVLKKAENNVLEGRRIIPRMQRTRFEDLIEDLKQDYALRGLRTWSRREDCLAHLKPVFWGMLVKGITTEKLKGYIAKRLGEKAAAATINRELDCLKRMLLLGARCSPPKVSGVPHFPRLAENNVREGFLEHDEFLSVRGAASDYLKVPITIAYYTGMRMREIISVKGLRWEQVTLFEDGGCIRLASAQTKTKQGRAVFLSGDFLKVMLKAKELHDRNYSSCPYVCHREGKPFDNLRQGWLSACKRVGLMGKTFHDLRRTGVRNLIRAGVSETVAMKISGHKTRSVFDRYNVTSEEDLKQAAKRLNQYMEAKKVTIPVTVEALVGESPRQGTLQALEIWRRGRDLNSRTGYPVSGFQDRHVRPLRHPSKTEPKNREYQDLAMY
ncbi:MAG: putative Phage integrase [Nitrospira sp.]|nr:putative Phage integrase [Nitrospira sp.]